MTAMAAYRYDAMGGRIEYEEKKWFFQKVECPHFLPGHDRQKPDPGRMGLIAGEPGLYLPAPPKWPPRPDRLKAII